MTMSDPVADMLSRVRNALMRGHAVVRCPFTNLKQDIGRVLKQEGFISDLYKVGEADDDKKPTLEVVLKYNQEGDSVIRGLKRVSKPGLRRHTGYQGLEKVYNGQGISIVTTSQGVLSDAECRTRKVGGEILCYVW